ncbi:hmgr-1 [Pristionchus pacificus]|uniref:3-hydroxy-3-methylglutaryl coenzyme A reductase n=1 Tax=Pristionchus pacificus TaxID=54126 RepID=A0A2A6B4K8_PRIPA|nr:hmgr-1 [Pristionchus pacificus]|eukprot:PDM60804.1 hmgr-1 [Pristionchus pacificus]
MSEAARVEPLDGLDTIIDKFRALLASAESNQDDWKEQALALLDRSISETRQDSHKPIFTLAEDDSDETNSESAPEAVVEGKARPSAMSEVRPTLERTIDELESDWNKGVQLLPGDVLRLLNRGKAKSRELEARLPDYETAVAVRRAFVAPLDKLAKLPYTDYDYKFVTNACCENVVGYVPVPVGVAGPLKINNGTPLHVPMATTEGALVASTNRGCTAIMKSGGVSAHVYAEGMTRAPVVQFDRATEAVRLKQWLDKPENFAKIKGEFDGSSRFAKLDRLEMRLDGRQAHLRFTGKTGDAMGMNMISKATSQAMKFIQSSFPTMKVVALSGNSCTDKKAAAINWILGRGRSVVADCVLPASVVRSVLKTTPRAMAEAGRAKLDSGSAAAGAIGGANAHAANIVAAIFIATGQDAAQVVSSSMCATRLEETEDGSLYASVTLPCMECGTVGGGTVLPAQRACLEMLGVAGPSPSSCAPGTNAATLAEIIASTVLAGELSLMAALCTDDLVSSHLKLNRSRLNLYENASGAASQPTVQLLHPQNTIRGKSAERTIKVNCSSIL